MSISFDEAGAPANFVDTTAVRGRYASLGVTFSAPGLDGGAILDQASSFSVSGYSAPNFLAFNCDSTLADGGRPCPPETLSFDPRVGAVSFGAGRCGTLTAELYDVSGGLLSTQGFDASQSALARINLRGQGIARVLISMSVHTPPWCVIDDLVFERDVDADGYTPSGGDCDDTRPEVPSDAEVCDNGVDDDCDGETDMDDADCVRGVGCGCAVGRGTGGPKLGALAVVLALATARRRRRCYTR